MPQESGHDELIVGFPGNIVVLGLNICVASGLQYTEDLLDRSLDIVDVFNDGKTIDKIKRVVTKGQVLCNGFAPYSALALGLR